MEHIGDIVNWVLTAIPTITSVYLYRRMRRGEVASQEIRNTLDHIDSADRLVDLVEKANEKAMEKHKEYYESIIRDLTASYEKIIANAVDAARQCRYWSDCALFDILRQSADKESARTHHQRHDANCRDPA